MTEPKISSEPTDGSLEIERGHHWSAAQGRTRTASSLRRNRRRSETRALPGPSPPRRSGPAIADFEPPSPNANIRPAMTTATRASPLPIVVLKAVQTLSHRLGPRIGRKQSRLRQDVDGHQQQDGNHRPAAQGGRKAPSPGHWPRPAAPEGSSKTVRSPSPRTGDQRTGNARHSVISTSKQLRPENPGQDSYSPVSSRLSARESSGSPARPSRMVLSMTETREPTSPMTRVRAIW